MKHIFIALSVATLVFIVAYVIVHNDATAPVIEGTEQPVARPTDEMATQIEQKRDLIVLDTPKPLATVASPITLTGKARGYWFFEASFPVVVVDWDGRIVGEGVATAEGDWMTEDFVPFRATVSYTIEPDTYSKKGAIILMRDNPSGLPENDDALEIPIVFE